MTIRCLASAAVVAGLGAICLSCSDPVPPPAQGAVHFKVARALDEKYMCPHGGEGTIGVLDGETKTEIPDQTNGVSVTCSVTPAGGGYTFSATLTQAKTTFSISGSVTGTTGTASVSVQTDAIVSSIQSAATTPCTITIDTTDGPSLSAAAGRIYAGFDCALMQDPGDATPDVDGCGIKGTPPATGKTPPGGYFAFDNCGQ